VNSRASFVPLGSKVGLKKPAQCAKNTEKSFSSLVKHLKKNMCIPPRKILGVWQIIIIKIQETRT
jgi:hypothetical protein